MSSGIGFAFNEKRKTKKSMFRKAFSDWKCDAMFGVIYHANTLTLVDYDAQNKKTQRWVQSFCLNMPSSC